MTRARLHLDADTSLRALHKALVDRGHDVTRTPNQWMPLAPAHGIARPAALTPWQEPLLPLEPGLRP